MGIHSSVWLAFDHRLANKYQSIWRYCAIKVLSIHATMLCSAGIIQELQALGLIASTNRYLELRDWFYYTSLVDSTQHHLCLVLPLLSESIHTLRLATPSKTILPRIVKSVLKYLLDDLVVLHALNFTHGDIQETNVALRYPYMHQAIDADLEAEDEMDKNLRGFIVRDERWLPVWVSRPLQTSMTPEEIDSRYAFVLTGMGSARRFDTNVNMRPSYSFALQSPELLLGGTLRWEADIWAVGCLVFTMLTGKMLFNPVCFPDGTLDRSDLLTQMAEVSGITFAEASTTLRYTPQWSRYFDDEGDLLAFLHDRSNPPRQPICLDAMLEVVMNPHFAKHAASFIRTCLTLDPLKRSTAKSLRSHSWQKHCNMPGRYDHLEDPLVAEDNHDVSIDLNDWSLGMCT
ncbi:kinase-like domain-containing protein [Cristinia sonorae]|uniref:Kinase-like domain-containing protein n=1 Tax=Cristinia sonorae TaxID=1940300 RepID=A0A8K0UHX8_9AGAR|nr:kinase-like domain-containing protein [Cristinia sonorae]